MNKIKILHVFNNEIKFSKAFFVFLKDNKFDLAHHTLFQYSKSDRDYNDFNMKIIFSSLYSPWKHIKLLRAMFKSDKLILHNLASPWLLLYLFLFPKLIKKVYWVIWGKDLYFYKLLQKKHFYHKIYEYFRKKIFKKIKNIVSNFKGDFELAKRWYLVDAKFYKCFMYPSNLYKNCSKTTCHTKEINILVGNSADPSNNHLEILEILKQYNYQNIKIYTPLSYGDLKYAKTVISKGHKYFKSKFIPLNNFIPLDEYRALLSKIDIVIFAHNRQQAVGNLVTLLGDGKKVYLKKNTTHYDYFNSHDITTYNISEFDLEKIPSNIATSNNNKIKCIFSKEELTLGLKRVFYG